MSGLVELDDIRDAAERLRGIAVRTPLLVAPWVQDVVHAEVRLKCENLQHVGAFKLRGAYTMVSRLPDEERSRGVITFSSGNHGQAVAFAAARFRCPATIVMPTTAPRVKVEGARRLGARVLFEGTTSLERKARAEAVAHDEGLTMIPPFDHPHIIAGQGTVGLEILEDWPELEAVLVPVGGGGLLSGIAAGLRRMRPKITIVGVEPVGADAMRRSLAAGHPVTIDVQPTVADGLMPSRPGDLTFHHARELVDEIVTVEDQDIIDATARILTRSRLLVEYSGAATVAALLSGAWRPDGRRTAAVLSGGNLDHARIASLVPADT